METGSDGSQIRVIPPQGGWLKPFQPGQSGNPGGRPKAARLVSAALAELQDTAGASIEECVERFKAARGEKLCAADHKAIALFLKETNPKSMGQVGAIELGLDRLEGKVSQPIDVSAQIDIPSLVGSAFAEVRK